MERTNNIVEDGAVDVTDTNPENEVEGADRERDALRRRVVNDDLQLTQVTTPRVTVCSSNIDNVQI